MTEKATDKQITYLRLLASRMERLSADSIWARRASGLRRSLIKFLDQLDKGGMYSSTDAEKLITNSLEILRKAAYEIPDPNQKLSTNS